jgi:branched-subunit amino acid aminotransferase/4-amino-4-deoxychorismate lyase
LNVPPPAAVCWLNGLPLRAGEAALAVFDPGLLAGVGLFETLAVHEGRALQRNAHFDRLERGAETLGIDLPAGERLREVVTAAERQPECSPDGWLKIVVTAGGRWIVFCGAMEPEDRGRPASAVVLPWRRNPADPLVGLKSLNYAANVLGLAEARRRGADEGLWLNVRGRFAEGCTSNLFVIRGRQLHTPSEREGILPGIVRSAALGAARKMGLSVHEGCVRWKRLAGADEAFLTSSVRGIRPLVRLEGKPVGGGTPGTVTRRIAAEVARIRGAPAPPVVGA